VLGLVGGSGSIGVVMQPLYCNLMHVEKLEVGMGRVKETRLRNARDVLKCDNAEVQGYVSQPIGAALKSRLCIISIPSVFPPRYA